MRIITLDGSIGSARAARHRSSQACKPDVPLGESRALIAIDAPAPTDHAPRVTRHPAAGFLTQLIATQMHAPQTRARRRVEPEEAIGVYGVALARAGRAGRRLSQYA